ncbi:MAG TPA: DUF4410 domain-containing protein [Thermoanaerobaculia bacterium]|nr:DUF4410 domain-containing protein [Thermoanaerobaculia bacterium]
MSHALALLLLLLGRAASAPPKPLAGYDEVVVDRFSIEKDCDFSMLQSDAVQQAAVVRLRAKKIVAVIDRLDADGAEAAKAPPADGVKRMTVTATVVEFARGSRTARSIGIGAGATKLRVRFTIKDAVTGAELFTTEHLGRYSYGGGTNEAGFSAVACEVVDGLIADIERNR